MECTQLLLQMQQPGGHHGNQGGGSSGIQDLQDSAGVHQECAFQKCVALLPLIDHSLIIIITHIITLTLLLILNDHCGINFIIKIPIVSPSLPSPL